jgi:hypothetical protein
LRGFNFDIVEGGLTDFSGAGGGGMLGLLIGHDDSRLEVV